jgi:hypothetical protein
MGSPAGKSIRGLCGRRKRDDSMVNRRELSEKTDGMMNHLDLNRTV